MTRKLLLSNRSKQPKANLRKIITREWVETADERCPLACVWFALGETPGKQDDEPGLSGPAFYRSLRKAGFFAPYSSFWSTLNATIQIKS